MMMIMMGTIEQMEIYYRVTRISRRTLPRLTRRSISVVARVSLLYMTVAAAGRIEGPREMMYYKVADYRFRMSLSLPHVDGNLVDMQDVLRVGHDIIYVVFMIIIIY